ncbi:MAG: hypothetical protein VB042_08595 [Victivallaceae bacterium]|nr:hypothetical protein [Victivallaceae bacterium]
MAHLGEKPEYEELLLALEAMSALATLDRMALREVAKAEQEGKDRILTSSASWQLDNRRRRMQRAMTKPPAQWLGWNNDPRNPACVAARKLAQEMFAKFEE